MTIHEIDDWFQCAARLMFAAEHRGEHSFYPCDAGPSCPWPDAPVYADGAGMVH
jgi:hypothetical protein